MSGSLHVLAQARSVSDDDLCATCARCDYRPGDLSQCTAGFPGKEDPDGYVYECAEYACPNFLAGVASCDCSFCTAKKEGK